MFSAANSSIIQSIQSFSISISGTSATATISSVTTANSVIIYNGYQTTQTGRDSEQFGGIYAKVVLTNSTTVTASTFDTAAAGAVVVKGYVVEFKSSVIQSVQVKEFVFGSASTKTISISSVTLANSAILYCGGQTESSAGTSNAENWSLPTLEFADNVSITANKNTFILQSYAQCNVVEFVSGIIKSRNQEIITVNPSPTDATISAVNLNKTIMFYSGVRPGGNVGTSLPSSFLYNSTTVRGVNGGSNNGRTASQILEFNVGIASIQYGSVTIGVSSTSNTSTITSVNTSKSIVVFNGLTSSSSSNFDSSITSATIELTNSTTVTAARGASNGSDSLAVYFQVVTFV